MHRALQIALPLVVTIATSFADAKSEPPAKWTEIKLAHVDSRILIKLLRRRPQGIEDVVALGRDRLLVRGTSDAVRELSDLIAALDQPRGRLKVKTWLVQTDAKAIVALTGTAHAIVEEPFVAYLRGNWEKVLTQLEQTKSAHVLSIAEGTYDANQPIPLTTVSKSGGSISHQLLAVVMKGGIVSAEVRAGDIETPPKTSYLVLGLSATVRSGDTIAMQAPGFGKDDQMTLLVQLTIEE